MDLLFARRRADRLRDSGEDGSESQDDNRSYHASDEENQLWSNSSRDQSDGSSTSGFDGGSIDGPGGPPCVVVPAHTRDESLILSVIDEVESPAIKTALTKLMEHCRYPIGGASDSEWTSSEILEDGLWFAGYDLERLKKNNQSRKVAWFKAHYGVEPTTLAPYFAGLREMHPEVTYKNCFMTLNWLFGYDTYPVLSARWGCCEEYIGATVIDYFTKMAELGRKKIVFELEHDVEIGRSVDTVTFMISEMRLDPSSDWFDWKTHSGGLVSEHLTCVTQSVWLSCLHTLPRNTRTVSPSVSQKIAGLVAHTNQTDTTSRFSGGATLVIRTTGTVAPFSFSSKKAQSVSQTVATMGSQIKLLSQRRSIRLTLRSFWSVQRIARRRFTGGSKHSTSLVDAFATEQTLRRKCACTRQPSRLFVE